MSFGEYLCIFQLGIHLGMELLGGTCIFSRSRHFQCTVLPVVCESSLSSTFSPSFDAVCLHFSSSDGCVVVALGGLICITLTADEVY